MKDSGKDDRKNNLKNNLKNNKRGNKKGGVKAKKQHQNKNLNQTYENQLPTKQAPTKQVHAKQASTKQVHAKQAPTKQVHAGFVALVGPANAGKSTLFNAFIGYKVAAMSSKVQTTRKIHLGIHNTKKGQLVFMDTPGLMEEITNRKKTELENFMTKQSLKALQDADMVLLVVSPDLKNIEEQMLKQIQRLKKKSKNLLVILNKKDIRKKYLKVFQSLENILKKENLGFQILSKSKEEDSSRKRFLSYLMEQAPLQKAPFYDQDIYTPHSLRYICSEIIYQNCFHYLHQEIPYHLAIHIHTYQQKGATLHLLGEIITSKESHKGIIIGQKGKTLKEISQAAREQLEKMLKTAIFIRLQVRHQHDWTKHKKTVKTILS